MQGASTVHLLLKKCVSGSIHPDLHPAETCPPTQLRSQLYFLFICLLIPENNVRAASVRGRGCRSKHWGLYLCAAPCRSGPASSARCHSPARWPGHCSSCLACGPALTFCNDTWRRDAYLFSSFPLALAAFL